MSYIFLFFEIFIDRFYKNIRFMTFILVFLNYNIMEFLMVRQLDMGGRGAGAPPPHRQGGRGRGEADAGFFCLCRMSQYKLLHGETANGSLKQL